MTAGSVLPVLADTATIHEARIVAAAELRSWARRNARRGMTKTAAKEVRLAETGEHLADLGITVGVLVRSWIEPRGAA
jgi:hypothetical protein